MLYTEVHPVTFFGNIPNWLESLKPLVESHYNQVVPGHGPTVDDNHAGRKYFKSMYNYLEDFHGHLLEIKPGRRSAEEVAEHMLNGSMHRWAKHEWSREISNNFSLEHGISKFALSLLGKRLR